MKNFFSRLRPAPSAADIPTRAGWAPTHQHKKGGYYRLINHGVNEADGAPVAIYDDIDGKIWVRVLSEFEDGRFTQLVPQAPKT